MAVTNLGFGSLRPPSSGFDLGGGGWQDILMGLAMLDAGRPRINPPPLMQTLAPMMQLQAQRGQQQREADFRERVLANAPPMLGVDDGVGMMPAPSVGSAPSAGVAPAYPNTGVPNLSAGGALGQGAVEKFLDLAEQHESGGRNIMQQVVPPGGGYNPSVGRVTGPSTAQGLFQITNSTWREFAPKAGVDLGQFPNAMSAPPEIQRHVARTIATTDGVQHWVPYNSNLRAAVRAAGLPESGPIGSDVRSAVATGADAPPVQLAQAAPQTMTDAAPDAVISPQQAAQARAIMPQTAPPPRPDAVSGATTQRAAAIRSFHYWSRAMIAAGMMGEGGRGIIEAAKANVDLARDYLSSEQKKRLDAIYDPMIARMTEQARTGPLIDRAWQMPDANPALQGQISGAREQGQIGAQLSAAGLVPGSPEWHAAARNRLPDTRPEAVRLAEAANATGDPRIAGAIPGQAPTAAMKESQVFLRGSPEEQAALRDAQAGSRPQTTINNVVDPIIAGIGKSFDNKRTAAESAVTSINAIHRAREMVDRGIISGPGANERATLQRLGELMGLPAEQAANTAAFKAAIGERTLAIVKTLGFNPSNVDLAFAERLAAGDPTLGESSIRLILDVAEAAERNKISNYNAEAQRILQAAPQNLGSVASILTVDMPAAYRGAVLSAPGAADGGRPATPGTIQTPYGTIRQVR